MPRGVPSEKVVLGRLAQKVMAGQRLTYEEFQTAKKAGFWTDERVTYEDYVVAFYEDDDITGMLCTKVARTVKRDEQGNDIGGSFCMFGIHAHQVKRDFMTRRQVQLFMQAGWDESQLGSGIAEQVPAHPETE